MQRWRSIEKGTTAEKQRRKATGLRANTYDSGVTNMKAHGFRDTGRLYRRPPSPGKQSPKNLAHLTRALDRNTNIALPLRAKGAGSSSTDCNIATHGTVINTTSLDQITHIDTYNHTVTAQAGMLGVIYEVTLKVRPITNFAASHRSMDVDTFAQVSDRLAKGNIGLKFYLMPYRNHVYLDLRHYESVGGNAYNAPWKIKDWGESTVLPNVFRSLSRVVPIPSVRYQLMDSISATTHGLVNSKLVRNGNNVTAGGRHRRRKPSNLLYSTWCFPASDFSVVVKAYARFCRETFAQTAYRCDLPAVGYRVARDNSALLSPSFDEPLIALQTVSTQRRGWDSFVMDLSEFAENWGGTPLFNQSLAARDAYVSQTYGGRMEFFKKLRRQLDPENRFLNPYLARYFK